MSYFPIPSGWSGERPIPQGRMNKPACLVMKRMFACPNKTEDEREELELGESADLVKAFYGAPQ